MRVDGAREESLNETAVARWGGVVTESASHSLFRVRDALGISQARMAELLELNTFTYHAFERGRRVPPPERWRAIKARLARLDGAMVPGPRKYERCPTRVLLNGDYPVDTVIAIWPKRGTDRRHGRVGAGMILEDGRVIISWLRPSEVTPHGALPLEESFASLESLQLRVYAANMELTCRA